MDLIRAIQRDNREWVGKFYLKKAVSFALEERFTLSYEYFKEGLNFLTCDCDDGWLAEYENCEKNIFRIDVSENGSVLPYFFVKAYILSFGSLKKDLYVALDTIERYLEITSDEYAHYVKGRILRKLDDREEALTELYEAMLYNRSARIEYWIGRVSKELELPGALCYCVRSLKINPSSWCCAREMREMYSKGDYDLAENSATQNLLIDLFLDENRSTMFSLTYRNFQNQEVVTLKTGEQKVTKLVLDEFRLFFTGLLNKFQCEIKDNGDELINYPEPVTQEEIDQLLSVLFDPSSKQKVTEAELFDQNNFHAEEENFERANLESVLLQLEDDEVEEEEFYFDDDDDSFYDYDYDDGYMSANDNPYYNDNLEMDQQSQEFWDSF